MEKVCLYMLTASALSAGSSLPARRFYFIYDFKTWTDAQTYCRQDYTDLVTIEDMEDVNVLNNMKNLSRMIYSVYSYRAWHGLYNDVNGWRWSDGSSSSFRFWNKGKPNSANYCATSFYAGSGGWEDWNCQDKKAFVCYDIPVLKQVVKLKLLKASSVDLNDPAVLQNLLKQLKQKLKDQGVDGDVTLSWKKQEDGNIFSNKTHS